MAMPNQKLEDNTNDIETKDLESLLQQHFDDGNLKIKRISSTNLLPNGENFASIILKLDVVLQKNESEDRELHLVKKIGIVEGIFLPVLSALFEGEIFMYAELMNVYRDIEKEAGIEENDLIDILPKFFGYRNNLYSENAEDVGIYFLMENLKENGYNTMDRRTGIDVHHAKIALTSLARYHALGVAMLEKRPNFRPEAIKYAQMASDAEDCWESGFQTVRLAFAKFPKLQQFVDQLEKSMECYKIPNPPEQPWATITHGDFWTNNILFRGDCIKIIDFQLYRYDTPLRDVLYFVCGSLDDVATENHVDELLEVYRCKFLDTLRRVGCDDSLYGDFEDALKEVAVASFARLALSLKFFVAEVQDDGKDRKELLESVLHDEEISEVYADRLFKLVDFYKARKWF